jgi:hypothetical protein
MSACARRIFPPSLGGVTGSFHEVANGVSTKLTSAPESMRAEYTQPFNERRTERWDGITAAAHRVRSTVTNDVKRHDTSGEVVSDGAGVGPANVAAFTRIEAEGDGEGLAGGAAVDVDGGEEDFCAAAERVTLSER